MREGGGKDWYSGWRETPGSIQETEGLFQHQKSERVFKFIKGMNEGDTVYWKRAHLLWDCEIEQRDTSEKWGRHEENSNDSEGKALALSLWESAIIISFCASDDLWQQMFTKLKWNQYWPHCFLEGIVQSKIKIQQLVWWMSFQTCMTDFPSLKHKMRNFEECTGGSFPRNFKFSLNNKKKTLY